MKRADNNDALRDRLARLIAEPGPPRLRGTEMWKLAEQLAAATGESPAAVLRRATTEAAQRLAREDRR